MAAATLVLACWLAGSATSASQTSPSFSGTWDAQVTGELDVARLVISQDAASITITGSGGLGGQLLGTRTLRLDQSETTWETRDARGEPVRHTSRVEWVGAALTVRTATSASRWSYQNFEAYSFDADGNLIRISIDTPLQSGFMLTNRVVYRLERVRSFE